RAGCPRQAPGAASGAAGDCRARTATPTNAAPYRATAYPDPGMLSRSVLVRHGTGILRSGPPPQGCVRGDAAADAAEVRAAVLGAERVEEIAHTITSRPTPAQEGSER